MSSWDFYRQKEKFGQKLIWNQGTSLRSQHQPPPTPPALLPPPPLPPVHSNNNRDQVNKHMTMLNNESNRHMPAPRYEERRDYVYGRSETHLLIPFTLDSGWFIDKKTIENIEKKK